jgi:hypothetical protein
VRLIAAATENFDRIQAKLDQFATPGIRSPDDDGHDDDGQPPPSTQAAFVLKERFPISYIPSIQNRSCLAAPCVGATLRSFFRAVSE